MTRLTRAPKNTGKIPTPVAQIQLQMAAKVAQVGDSAQRVPTKPSLVRVKTELCLAKKATPAPVAVKPSADFVLDCVLRAAMPQDGPVWLEYDDVLDISMYSHEEIDNEHDHLCTSLGHKDGF